MDYTRTQGFFAPDDVVMATEVVPPEMDRPAGRTCVVPDNAPPSSHAIADFLNGQQGAGLRVLGLTAARGLALIPGLWIAGKLFHIEGMTGWKLIGASYVTSGSITGALMSYYFVRSRYAARQAARVAT